MNDKKNILQRRIGMLVTVLLVLSVLLCLYTVVQVMSKGYVSLGGFMMFRVVTGSMEPTIPTGALLLTRQVDIDSIVLGDIVCFRTQEAAIWGKIVTHRVVEVLENADGSLLLATQGDANLVADGYFVTEQNLIGKVIWHTGEKNVLAVILSIFTNKIGFLACIVFPCLLLASLILRDTVKNIRKELGELMDELEPGGAAEQVPVAQEGMTDEERARLQERIRAELMEEMMRGAEKKE